MTACTTCGHFPLTGRYCSHCGTAAASGVAPEPTPLGTPPPARFPMFADETAPAPQSAEAPPPSAPTPETSALPATPEEPAAYDAASADVPPVRGEDDARARTRPTAWQVGVGIVLLFAVLGGALVLLGGGDVDGTGDETAADPATTAVEESAPGTGAAAPVPPPPGSRLDPTEVTVPGVAPASQDNDGNQVTYDAGNLFDEDPRTAWRVAGDATGAVLTFRFDEPVTVTDVGLINGYAKEDPPNDWYAANRRVLSVEWTFGDGSSVTQELTEEREVQRMEIDEVETDVVELRLTEVGAPGGRDYTAISEVTLSSSG